MTILTVLIIGVAYAILVAGSGKIAVAFYGKGNPRAELDKVNMTAKNDVVGYRAADTVLRAVLRCVPLSSATESIALWWGYKFRPKPRVVRLRSGALIKITHIDHLQLLLYYFGTFEPRSLSVMCEHVKSGDTILDVGANIGLFTIEGAKAVGQSGQVISIEAAPQHAKSVKESVSLNGMTNVDVVSVAVGDADGTATLTLPRNTNFGMFTLGKIDGDESFDVPVRRIDDILAGRKVDFIKMDIEGSEYRALVGAEKTLKSRPPILIELNEAALNACGSSARQVKEFLFDRGYKGKIIGQGEAITLDQIHACDECLFVSD